MNNHKLITIEPRWSKIYFDIDETKALKLGLMIEVNDDENLKDFLLNISVWIQLKGYFSSTSHILKINNQEVLSLPIKSNSDYKWGEKQLLYFKNEIIPKSIFEKEKSFLIELSHIQNFNTLMDKIYYDTSIDYNTYQEENEEKIINQNIIIPPLAQYEMVFMNEDTLLEKRIKYLDIDFSMNINPPAKKGFSFQGWRDEFNRPVSSVWTENVQMNFQPIWKRNIFNITYVDTDGKIIKTELSNEQGEYNILNIIPAHLKSGYKFKGWNTQPSQTEVLTHLVNLTEDAILFPVYELKTFTLVYNTNQEDIYKCINQDKFNISYQRSFFDSFLTNEIPIYNKKYKFICWKIVESNEDIFLYPGNAIPSTFLDNYNFETITLSAVREPISYTVSYYERDNTLIKTESFYHNEGIALSYYDGQNNTLSWSLDIKFYEPDFKVGDLLPNKNLVLYALKEIPYVINYTDGKGNVFTKKYSYYQNQKYTQFIPEKTKWYYDSDNGLYFNKWFITIDNNIYYFIPNFSQVLETDWIVKNNYILTLNTMWGDAFLREHYYLINSQELSAENYKEYDSLNDLIINDEYIDFFHDGTINALELKEVENNDTPTFYSNINNINKGEIHFSKFKQHEPIAASYLALALTNGDNVTYLTLDSSSEDSSYTLFTL